MTVSKPIYIPSKIIIENPIIFQTSFEVRNLSSLNYYKKNSNNDNEDGKKTEEIIARTRLKLCFAAEIAGPFRSTYTSFIEIVSRFAFPVDGLLF